MATPRSITVVHAGLTAAFDKIFPQISSSGTHKAGRKLLCGGGGVTRNPISPNPPPSFGGRPCHPPPPPPPRRAIFRSLNHQGMPSRPCVSRGTPRLIRSVNSLKNIAHNPAAPRTPKLQENYGPGRETASKKNLAKHRQIVCEISSTLAATGRLAGAGAVPPAPCRYTLKMSPDCLHHDALPLFLSLVDVPRPEAGHTAAHRWTPVRRNFKKASVDKRKPPVACDPAHK